MMDRFHALQVFVAVAQQGGFAAAARRLNMSPPTVTRAVSQLESRIGTRLFVRTTRRVRLTESGQRFFTDAKQILADLSEAEEAAVGTHAAPRGELRITAPVLFGRLFVAPVLADFLGAHPKVTARTMFVDRVVNLIDEGLDIGIRIGPLPDSTLTAVRVGSVRRVIVAAPGYLAQAGRPSHPDDLMGFRTIQTSALSESLEWPFMENGKPTTARVTPCLTMNTNDAAIDQIIAGGGISRLLSYQAAAGIAAGQLETVLDAFMPPAWPVHVIHQEGRLVSAKIRAFVDFIVERLRSEPALT